MMRTRSRTKVDAHLCILARSWTESARHPDHQAPVGPGVCLCNGAFVKFRLIEHLPAAARRFQAEALTRCVLVFASWHDRGWRVLATPTRHLQVCALRSWMESACHPDQAPTGVFGFDCVFIPRHVCTFTDSSQRGGHQHWFFPGMTFGL